jgi:hypothetical protein
MFRISTFVFRFLEGKAGSYGRGTETSTVSQWTAAPRRRWRPWRTGRRAWWPAPRRRTGGRWSGRSRRPSARKAPIFPQKESLQVLRREDGLHRLQACGYSFAIRSGARQDSAAAHDRSLFAPPALARRGHQARAQHRLAAVCRQRRRHAGPAPGRSGGRSRSAGRSRRYTYTRGRTSTSCCASRFSRDPEGVSLLGSMPQELRETGA